jgi:hypothetical protein
VTLIDNGNNLIYDTVQNITWYAPVPTLMSWSQAMSWAEALTVGGTTAGTWSLPVTPGTTSGFTNEGQMGYLYYNELGNTAYTGSSTPPIPNTAPFTYLQPSTYWSATVSSGFTSFTFNFANGSEATAPNNSTSYKYYALAVHSGDVGAPVPPSLTLTVVNAGKGSGAVTSNPSGINCSSTCWASYNNGTRITLTPIANSGSTFTGWSGACSSQNESATCVVTVNGPETATAHYIITGVPTFSDVSSTSGYESYIEAIYNNDITTGCGNGDYCPSEDVTRNQVAAFIIRALDGETFTCNGGVPGAAVACAATTPYFADVPSTDPYFTYIQKLKELGITTGCGNGDYCPSGDATRDQMAAFLARAFLGMQ